jgi:hypothetical protein
LCLVLGVSCTSSPPGATTQAPPPDSPTSATATSTSLAVTTTARAASTTTLAAPAPTELPPPAKTCGVERWAVKTGMDPDAAKVDQAKVLSSTVGALSALPAPSRPTGRVAPTETSIFSVEATLTKIKMESDDSDYHLVLDDGQGRTMIAEIPSTDCIGTSPFKSAIGEVRAEVFTRFHPGPSFKAVGSRVTVTGVGFFDRIHGQTGVAANGIELHPVLRIAFG